MLPVDIILKKRNGFELSAEEIEAFVRGATDGSFMPYQLSALLMAICLRGMTRREAVDLALAMAHSGEMLDLSAVGGPAADKHSTGGVGDTTTLILVPLVAACGVKVAKMSGRGLGHTGGTLDKLGAIPGFQVALEKERFMRQVREVGCAVVGQTGELAPADKTLYALRDVTGTVDSLPLIASSILSKKLAAGADCVVLDVKTGSGALMHTLEDSMALARLMVDVGNMAGRKYSAIVTDMDQPLGNYIGNALEVEEAVLTLSGRVSGPLCDVSLLLGAHMLRGAGRVSTVGEGKALLEKKLASGEGLETFARMIEAQGGDAKIVEDVSRLPHTGETVAFKAGHGGYLSGIQTTLLGNAARVLGAGRVRKEDEIDPAVGIVMRKRVGDQVDAGETVCELHIGARGGAEEACALLCEAIHIGEERPAPRALVFGEIDGEGEER